MTKTYGPPTALHLSHHLSLLSLSASIQSPFSLSHLRNSWKTSAPICVSCSLEWERVNCPWPSTLTGSSALQNSLRSTTSQWNLAKVRRSSFLISKHILQTRFLFPISISPLIHLRCSVMSEPLLHTCGVQRPPIPCSPRTHSHYPPLLHPFPALLLFWNNQEFNYIFPSHICLTYLSFH